MVTDAASPPGSEGRVAAGIRFSAADLSQSGAFLRSSLLFEVGEELDLEINLPSGEPVKVRGRVVRVSRARDGDPRTAGMGIEFLDLADSDRQLVMGFIEEMAEAE
jgi:Tfp pilus assembly protein PilZ